MPGKKRANQPGYIQKVNARGHKYWAKDPNYKGNHVDMHDDDDDYKNPNAPLSNNQVVAEYYTYEHVFNNMDNWAENQYLTREGEVVEDGFTVVKSSIEDYGSGSIIAQSPSGQFYQIDISGVDYNDPEFVDIHVNPVVKKHKEIEQYKVSRESYNALPDFSHQIKMWDSEGKSGGNGYVVLPISWMNEVDGVTVKSLGHITPDLLVKYGLEDEVKGYSTSIGDEMIVVNAYSMKYNDKDFIIISESPSDDYWGDSITVFEDGGVDATIYSVDTSKTNKVGIDVYEDARYYID